jgi:hypothetical protein
MNHRYLISRVHLPSRKPALVVTGASGETDTPPALIQAMAARISSLPGMSSCSVGTDNAEPLRSYYLDSAFVRDQNADAPCFFASLDSAGRVSLIASIRNQAEILRSGWGALNNDQIVIVPPRDSIDLGIIWRIIMMAYFDLATQKHSNAWSEFRRAAAPTDMATAGRSELVSGEFF